MGTGQMPRNRDGVDLSQHSTAADAPASFHSPSLLCWASFAVHLWQGGRYPAMGLFSLFRPSLSSGRIQLSFLVACYCPEGSSDFFGLNCTALRPEPTLAGEHVGTLCHCRRQGLPGWALPTPASQLMHVAVLLSLAIVCKTQRSWCVEDKLPARTSPGRLAAFSPC